jgi:hypothetical protein
VSGLRWKVRWTGMLGTPELEIIIHDNKLPAVDSLRNAVDGTVGFRGLDPPLEGPRLPRPSMLRHGGEPQ